MIVAAVLAAGGSSRLGRPKQLLEWRGKPLVAHAVEAARVVGPVAVVVGAARLEIERVMAPPIAVLANEEWQTGMASSVRVATQWARSLAAEALVLHLVDQPFIDGAHLSRLVDEHRSGAPLVGTAYADTVGAPALFSSALFDELLALGGDRGAAPILRAHAETRAIPGPQGALDIDTPEDAAHLLAASSPNAIRR